MGSPNNVAAYDGKKRQSRHSAVPKKLLKIICDRTLTGPDYAETTETVTVLRKRI